MEHREFQVGRAFWCGDNKFLCTDMGTRTIIAVRIGAKEMEDPSWLNGPPFAVDEVVFDEDDIKGCSKERTND